jgi:hypothetical protein
MNRTYQTEAEVAAKVAKLRAAMADVGIDVDTVLASNEHITVEYEFTQHRDTVRLIRRVWNKSYRRTDQYVLCETNVAVWESFAVPGTVSDLVAAYGSAAEWEGAQPA